jgi:hypothetical protein
LAPSLKAIMTSSVSIWPVTRITGRLDCEERARMAFSTSKPVGPGVEMARITASNRDVSMSCRAAAPSAASTTSMPRRRNGWPSCARLSGASSMTRR